MLPDEKIGCHRTGFAMSCLDGVVKHKCRLWCHVSGTDANGKDVDVFGCSDELEIKLIHEVAKEVRQTAASVDKVATEVKRTRDQATVEHVMLVKGVKASLPLLHLSSRGILEGNEDGRYVAAPTHNSGDPDRGVVGDSEVLP